MADCRVQGNRHRRVFPTHEEAEAALRVWEAAASAAKELRRLPSSEPAPGPRETRLVTLGELFDGWLAHKRAISGGKPGSIRSAQASVRRLQRAFLRTTPAMALTGRQVDRFVEECRARGLRPASINHDLRPFKAALRWAADRDRGALLPQMPLKVRLVPEPKVTGATVRRLTITPEQLERLLDVSSPKLRAIFALCGYAGLRQAEVLHLKVGDVDMEQRLVSVREKPEAAWSPKTHQERDIEMGPRLHVELSQYLATLEPEERHPGAWLFTSSHHPGQRLGEIKPQVRRAFKRAGITVSRAGCHTLRKTWATAAGELGDYEALREMGGWSSWQAMAHYISAGGEQRRRIAERF